MEIIVGIPLAEHYIFMIIIQHVLQQQLHIPTVLGLHCAGSWETRGTIPVQQFCHLNSQDNKRTKKAVLPAPF